MVDHYKAGQTRRVRVHQLRQLPHPGVAVCPQTQLGATSHSHSDLKREAPFNRLFGAGFGRLAAPRLRRCTFKSLSSGASVADGFHLMRRWRPVPLLRARHSSTGNQDAPRLKAAKGPRLLMSRQRARPQLSILLSNLHSAQSAQNYITNMYTHIVCIPISRPFKLAQHSRNCMPTFDSTRLLSLLGWASAECIFPTSPVMPERTSAPE